MNNSFAQDTNTKEHPFGVLDTQTGDEYKGNRIPIRFEDIKKPTENLDLSTVKTEESQLPVKPDAVPATNTQKKVVNTFTLPPLLTAYITRLVGLNPKLKVFEFDVKFAGSNDEIRKLVNAEFASGLITEKEKTDILRFLAEDLKIEVAPVVPIAPTIPVVVPVTVPEEKVVQEVKTEVVPIIPIVPVVVPEEKIPEKIEMPVELAPEVTMDVKPVVSKEEKLENLKNNHGIVIESVKPALKSLGDSIVDKSNNLWKGNEVDMRVSHALLGLDEAEIPEKAIKTAVLQEVFPLEFNGKPLQVVRGDDSGNANSVTVLLDGKEIAKGSVTAKGVDIKIDKAFKAGFLMGPTPEQQALEVAKGTMKDFKLHS